MNVFARGPLLYFQDTFSPAETPAEIVDFFIDVNGEKSEIFDRILLDVQRG